MARVASKAGGPCALLAAALLAACGPNDTDPGPGGVTEGEARALDEAAEMLDEQRLPAEALPSETPGPAPSPPSEAEPDEAAEPAA